MIRFFFQSSEEPTYLLNIYAFSVIPKLFTVEILRYILLYILERKKRFYPFANTFIISIKVCVP